MRKKIFIVDDEPDFTSMFKEILEGMGHYIVLTENNPLHALATARKFIPDLVFMDIMMPHKDGSELAADFLADDVLGNVPLVFLTALVSQQQVHSGSFVETPRTYMPKPVQWKELVECINQKTARVTPAEC